MGSDNAPRRATIALFVVLAALAIAQGCGKHRGAGDEPLPPARIGGDTY